METRATLSPVGRELKARREPCVSGARASGHTRHRRGFTLIEMLITIGIIVLVIGLALPALVVARRNAARTRIAADLQTLAGGLEAYRQDFKDYPRIDYAGIAAASGSNNIALAADDVGAIVLCWALLAPGPATGTGSDGADGPGFRSRGTTGDVHGPYIQPARFSVSGATDLDSTINDTYGHPYLYFPANKGANPATLFVGAGASMAQFQPATTPMYNMNDNLLSPTNPVYPSYPKWSQTPTGADIQQIMGDANANGKIDSNETPSTTAPYVLWSAGVDGLYGLDSNGKTDDVTNFEIPANLRR